MYLMNECWRWFGPDDPVSLADIRQAGAKGIVTALHHIPHGEVWPKEEVNKRRREIAKGGFTWPVVESITVHESIKTRSGNYREYIEKYKTSLRNVAAEGVKVVTYNFMPVNDWTRTSLDYPMADGSKAMYFDWVDLAIFDLFILKRSQAESSYSPEILAETEKRYKEYSKSQLAALAGVIMFGIPGEEKSTTDKMLENIQVYRDIDAHALRENLCYFQKEISETALECNIKLAIHPDDPPFPILGLPRVVSNLEDFEYFLNKVDNAANGVCFCTGSLGASRNNDLVKMIQQLGERIHFLHLRNVKKDFLGNFYESDHLDGDNDMAAIVREILKLQQRREISLPFRPDHGHQMLDDLDKKTNPGYSAIGRLRGLAEIRGLQMGLAFS